MAWKRTSSLIPRQLASHGLSGAIAAGRVCQEAERRYPNLFQAHSLVRGSLHVSVTRENQVAFRMIEGKLLEELRAFAQSEKLPIPSKIRLTISPKSDTL